MPKDTRPAETDLSQIAKLKYNKKEAAYALGVSVRTIEHLLANKKLRTHKVGAKVLIPAEDIRRIAKLEQMLDGR